MLVPGVTPRVWAFEVCPLVYHTPHETPCGPSSTSECQNSSRCLLHKWALVWLASSLELWWSTASAPCGTASLDHICMIQHRMEFKTQRTLLFSSTYSKIRSSNNYTRESILTVQLLPTSAVDPHHCCSTGRTIGPHCICWVVLGQAAVTETTKR